MKGIDLNAVRQTPEAHKELARLKKASQDVESIFMKLLVGQLRRSGFKGMLGSGMEAQVYADLLDEAVAGQMAAGRGVGLGRILYDRMEDTLLRRIAAKDKMQARAPEGAKNDLADRKVGADKATGWANTKTEDRNENQ